MAPDRPHSGPAKNLRKGFSVGPANLPDGTYKRKAQKIKKDLIHKAAVRRAYAKLKAREGLGKEEQIYGKFPEGQVGDERDSTSIPPLASLEPHPARQAMIDSDMITATHFPTLAAEEDSASAAPGERRRSSPTSEGKEAYQRRPKKKSMPFLQEAQAAQRAREEAQARRKQIEAAKEERSRKLEQRERWRRQMAKARPSNSGRPGGTGTRKLGRESKVLLEKVRRLVDQ